MLRSPFPAVCPIPSDSPVSVRLIAESSYNQVLGLAAVSFGLGVTVVVPLADIGA